MEPRPDIPLHFHSSFNELLDSFRNVIASMAWLKASGESAQQYFAPYPYIIELSCKSTDMLLKVDKSILTAVQKEGAEGKTPLFSRTLVSFYRILTIAVKDIVWEEPDFQPLLQRAEFQFLRHLRNASAHSNSFFFGTGRERGKTLEGLPVVWRTKTITENIEGTDLYMNYFGPGDLFVLLSDISATVRGTERPILA